MGPGRVKTRFDLVVMPRGRGIFAFFAVRVTKGLKIQGVSHSLGQNLPFAALQINLSGCKYEH
jgi:hypothetical protein